MRFFFFFFSFYFFIFLFWLGVDKKERVSCRGGPRNSGYKNGSRRSLSFLCSSTHCHVFDAWCYKPAIATNYKHPIIAPLILRACLRWETVIWVQSNLTKVLYNLLALCMAMPCLVIRIFFSHCFVEPALC